MLSHYLSSRIARTETLYRARVGPHNNSVFRHVASYYLTIGGFAKQTCYSNRGSNYMRRSYYCSGSTMGM